MIVVRWFCAGPGGKRKQRRFYFPATSRLAWRSEKIFPCNRMGSSQPWYCRHNQEYQEYSLPWPSHQKIVPKWICNSLHSLPSTMFTIMENTSYDIQGLTLLTESLVLQNIISRYLPVNFNTILRATLLFENLRSLVRAWDIIVHWVQCWCKEENILSQEWHEQRCGKRLWLLWTLGNIPQRTVPGLFNLPDLFSWLLWGSGEEGIGE